MLEATARGLAVHQIIGIDTLKARQEFLLPASLESLNALAIGYAGNNTSLDDEYTKVDAKTRQRTVAC